MARFRYASDADGFAFLSSLSLLILKPFLLVHADMFAASD
jgi:hypothetical protein